MNKLARKNFVMLMRQLPCVGCLQQGQIEFHHVQPKEFKISDYGQHGFRKVEQEVKKCVPLCPYCHDVVHGERYGCLLPLKQITEQEIEQAHSIARSL